MMVREYSRAKEFLSRVKDFLREREDVNGLPLGILLGLAAASSPQKGFFATAEEQGDLSLVMVMTTGHLILASAGPDWQRGVAAGAAYLARAGLSLTGVIGPREAAQLFALMWRPRLPLQVEMEQRIYRLDAVNQVTLSPGRLRLATEEDGVLLSRWIEAFCREALEEISPEQAQAMVTTGLASKAIYLWDDGQAVSMAKKTRPTYRGISLNLVYTPPEYRGRGYATSSVASLCRTLLDQGFGFCCLYTDLANPTSNKIYRDIGFVPVADSLSIGFT